MRKGVDWLKPASAAFYRRQRIWAHNGLLGSVVMAQTMVESILGSDSTTRDAKEIAANIRPLLTDLRVALRTRIDRNPPF